MTCIDCGIKTVNNSICQKCYLIRQKEIKQELRPAMDDGLREFD